MAVLQTRIFVPSNDPMQNWAETLLGNVIRVITDQYQAHLEWFWISRYISEINDSADCDVAQIHQDYLQPFQNGQPPVHRTIRFRFEIADAEETNFRQALQDLIQQEGYAISDIRAYDKVADAGNNRFLGIDNQQAGRKQQRADLVVNYYHAVSQLVLDALAGPDVDDRYRPERNGDIIQNPRGNTFQSLHHMFCNMTDVPLDVLVCQRGNQLRMGTAVYPPGPLHTYDNVDSQPIRF